MAVRFSQMATVPSGLLDYIKLKFPEVGFRMISLLGNYCTCPGYCRVTVARRHKLPPAILERAAQSRTQSAHDRRAPRLAQCEPID